jgi:hypothetical protein
MLEAYSYQLEKGTEDPTLSLSDSDGMEQCISGSSQQQMSTTGYLRQSWGQVEDSRK